MNEFLEKEDRIVRMLRTVYDPEIPVNIYDLGLIYKIDAKDDGSVDIDMTLTAPIVVVNGNMQINGSISQGTASGGTSVQMIGPMQVQNDVTAAGVSVSSHTHSGVQTGGGNTGTPNA